MLRTIAMPADTNPNGDIFGGWLLSQMDLAGANAARRNAAGRVVTVAIDAMTFLQRALRTSTRRCCQAFLRER